MFDGCEPEANNQIGGEAATDKTIEDEEDRKDIIELIKTGRMLRDEADGYETLVDKEGSEAPRNRR